MLQLVLPFKVSLPLPVVASVSLKNKPPSEESAVGLPIVECANCGVCCFHMGYPAYITPRDPMTSEEIDALEQQSGKKISAKRREELLAGHPGESHWHNVPDDLKAELEAYIAGYEKPEYGQTLDTFDGPCIWLDMETRMCKHHTVRPNVCRDFETGSPECLEWRRTYEEKIK